MKNKMIITDLDGTLINDNAKIDTKDIKTLYKLHQNGAVNVIATGRSLRSAINFLPPKIPVNYLIFSTGAGIMNWKTKEIIYKNQLSKLDVSFILRKIGNYKLDFSIQKEIPQNHEYFYFKNLEENIDFYNRNNIYECYAKRAYISDFEPITASQFLIIEPNINKALNMIKILNIELSDYKIIRATSPLDKKSVWIEIFPKEVSKANASNFILEKMALGRKNTFALGNDYNDSDLLDWAYESFVVENAPEDLKRKYKKTKSNNENGFTEFVERAIF